MTVAARAILGAAGRGAGGGGAGPDGTQNYVEVTVASSQVASTLTDFPVYVDLSDLPAAFFTNVQTDGGDVRVTENDGTTRCPVDLVAIDTGGSTGELHFLAASLSSSTDTVYRIYYNAASTLSQPGVATTYGRNAVWADYVAVYHMNEDPSGTVIDSTGKNDATTSGTMTSGDLIAAQLGDGIDFDGSDDLATVTDDVDNDATNANLALSAWVNPDNVGNATERWITKFGPNAGYMLRSVVSGPDSFTQFLLGTGSTLYQRTGNTALTQNAWQLIHGTYQAGALKVYLNGSADGSTLQSLTLSNAASDLAIGGAAGGGEHTDGTLDEVRIRDASVTAAWASAEYTNQNTPTTFYTVGTEQAA